jgi:uncharacterized protein involved in exopolysaccharide biosynthesis
MDEEIKKFEEDEINLIDLFLVLAKRKSLIIGITLTVAIITAIISLIIPPIYKAETKFLPPQHSSLTASQLLSQTVEQMTGIAPGILGIKSISDLYAEILKSNTILDRMIDKFDLMKVYDVSYKVDARKKLLSNIEVSVDKKSGIIKLSVYDKDPKRAADMANAFVEELKNLIKNLGITEASKRRIYFEERLKEVKEELAKAEEDMKRFQEKTGTVSVEEQAKAVIGLIANLRAQIAAKEAEIRAMRTYATPNNPELKRAEEALKTLRAELSRLEAKGGSNPNPLIPTQRFPEVSKEYLRKLRDLKFYEDLYGFLLKAYEAAKLDEAKDAPVIAVIDKATPPERKAKPKRTIMVLVATISAFFFSIFIAFFKEYIEKINQDPKQKQKIETIKNYLNFSFNFKKINFKRKIFNKS